MSDIQEIIIQAQQDAIKAHGLCDWFEEYPWLTGFIGDIHAPVWFLAENPSRSRLEEKAEEGASNENDQWNASPGDYLLREAITEAGLKTGDPKENEGWACYISNVDKEPCVVNERNAKKKEEGSNCLESQAEGLATRGARSDQGEPCFSIALRITSSLRMQAVSASFFGLPAASSRW